MHSALVASCTVYFWELAGEVGLTRLNHFAREFGLAQRTGVGINGEVPGFLADREWYEEHFGRFRVGYTLNTAIGQGNTRATLLAARPRLRGPRQRRGSPRAPASSRRIQAPDGQVIEEFEPRIRRHVAIDDAHLAYVERGMRGVVNEQNGTAHDARVVGGVIVAGKTGTAEVTRSTRTLSDPRRAWYFSRSHAWFAGYAPADDPEVAIVVLVEHGGAGGRTAAPIAIGILQEYLGDRETTASRGGSDLGPGALARASAHTHRGGR